MSAKSGRKYFPGKEAITAAILRKSYEWTFDPLLAALEAGREKPLEEIVSSFVDQAVALKVSRYAVETGIFKETLRQGLVDEAFKLDAEYIAKFTQALGRLVPVVRSDIPTELAANLLYQSLRASVLVVSIQRPDLVGSREYAQELKKLLLGYLAPPTSG